MASKIRVSWQSYLICLLLRWFVRRRFKPELDLTRYRQRVERFDARHTKIAPDVSFTDVGTDTVSGRWIKVPQSTNEKVLLYFHGGGFFLRSPKLYTSFLSRLCRLTQASAFLVDYRLAPEHPYPAAFQDCVASYRWLLNQGHLPHNLVLAGDSAGGCLTLATLAQLRDADEPLPACAALLSPATDMTVSGWSTIRNERKDPFFRLQTLLIIKNHYLQGAFAGHPSVSPLYSDFYGFPPLLFQAGSTELLLDDSLRAAEKAKLAGIEVDMQIWQRMPHVFQLFDWLPESHSALNAIAQFIQAHTMTPAKESGTPAKAASNSVH